MNKIKNPNKKKIFCLGISGMGMMPLCIFLKQTNEYDICGNDDNFREDSLQSLLSNGIEITDEYPSVDTDYLIHSSAIKENHPILVYAKKHNIKTFKRGEFLAKQLKGKKLVAITGSHGKSTTCALVTYALKKLNFDFSYINGAITKNMPVASFNGNSDFVIAEIDESDATIEKFSPYITLTLNYDWDHPYTYPNEQDLKNAFVRLFKRTKKTVIISKNDKVLNEISQKINPDFFITKQNDSFNQINIKAAKKLVQEIVNKKINFPKDFFNAFSGVKRRQDKILNLPKQKLEIFTDYAHHPNELKSYLSTIDKENSIIVFQPHRYSRTKQYAKTFANILSEIESALVYEVYPASEVFDKNATSKQITQFLKNKKVYCSSKSLLAKINILLKTKKINQIHFIGAGNIEQIANDFSMKIASKHLQDIPFDFIKKSVSLKKLTTLGIGGNAKYLFLPRNINELVCSFKTCSYAKLKHFVIANGSNILASDKGFNGAIIKLASNSDFSSISKVQDDKVFAGASVNLQKLLDFCSNEKNQLEGLEFLESLPASVGGALASNAGAFGKNISQYIHKIYYLDLDLYKIKTLNVADIQKNFSYRKCSLKNIIFLGAIFKLEKSKKDLKQMRYSFKQKRLSSQPKGKSAGCVFKNPSSNMSAGMLIDKSNLKSKSVGQIMISDIHANFFLNKKNGSSKDFLKLVKNVQNVVLKNFKISLKTEIIHLK